MHTSLHHYTLTVERQDVERRAKRNLGHREIRWNARRLRDRFRALARSGGGGLTPARV